MTTEPPRTSAVLTVSRTALRALIVLNFAVGVLILALFVASLAAGPFVMHALGIQSAEDNQALFWGMRLIMVVGIVSVPLVYIILGRLLAIVKTVSSGDPFVADNVVCLKTMAYAQLGLQVLHFIAGAVAAGVSTETNPLDIGGLFSVTGWLSVLLLFVLAQVFDRGTRMREDLEGTI